MRFGIREICDVVLKAKAAQKIGNKIFYKNEPVCYFDSLKTSSLEGQASTVYAQGGRGNPRLIGWEGERTITFTMEDALISPAGFAILSGAGLIEAGPASAHEEIIVHVTETTSEVVVSKANDTVSSVEITLNNVPYNAAGEDYIYVMLLKNGEVDSEPFIPTVIDSANSKITIENNATQSNDLDDFYSNCVVLVDYYTVKESGVQQIDITADKFGGNYYLEASTLFRDTSGVDLPAEFIIPNCKIQSNFTFTMASSGDPSTFTFTMDAFPDYTRFNKKKKVLASLQIIEASDVNTNAVRERTNTHATFDDLGVWHAPVNQ